ncbi:hypothetical protein PVAG01_07645 [Phlyctema vagabunda]|uniref:Uncharacterized protein n=1 Tax=Phlyctema vagabunda TaxID=108571 RepID=A0ABR4PCZ9_9HELO
MLCPVLQYPAQLASKHEEKAYALYQQHNSHDAFYIRCFAQLKDCRPEEAQYYLDLTYSSSVSAHQRKVAAHLRCAKERLWTLVACGGAGRRRASRSSRKGSQESETITICFSSSTLAFMQ